MKSPKEISLEKKILKRLSGEPMEMAKLIFEDEEIQHLHDYANTVSITRLNFNDHGPVHMRTVALNAITMIEILKEQGIVFNLEIEKVGTFEDSMVAVLLASLLHDVGMTIGRENHEFNSALLALPIINRLLEKLFPGDMKRRTVIRSVALEGITGHMATQKIHSMEAGLVMIADGCDMEKGRSRIPMMINEDPKPGDIHQYSSASIEKVSILKGTEKPLRIEVLMSASVGFFQIEEVLFKKISSSPLRPHIELIAGVKQREKKRYL